MNAHQNAQGTVEPVSQLEAGIDKSCIHVYSDFKSGLGVIFLYNDNAQWQAARLRIGAYYISNDVHVEVSGKS